MVKYLATSAINDEDELLVAPDLFYGGGQSNTESKAHAYYLNDPHLAILQGLSVVQVRVWVWVWVTFGLE